MENKDNIFSGFEAIAGALSPTASVETIPSIPELDDEIEVTDGIDNGTTDLDDSDKDIIDPSEITDATDDVEDANEDIDDTSDSTDDTTIEDKTNDLGEYEQDISDFVADKLFEKLGWERGEDEKFESVDDVVDYLSKVVEDSSQPEFANEDVERLNEYVNNGGNLRDFYEVTKSGVDTDNVDLENESNQKIVIREHLANQGYSNERINRLVQRYEDAGTLSEEAEDALELVKEYNEKREEKLLTDQKNLREAQTKQQQEFVSSVESNIKDLESIRGLNISKDDKKKLTNYVFKVGADGLTQYQKDYQKNLTKNFIESAYLTMKGDSVFNSVKKKESTDAVRSLKQKLQSKGKRGKLGGSDPDNKAIDLSLLSSATKNLRKI